MKYSIACTTAHWSIPFTEPAHVVELICNGDGTWRREMDMRHLASHKTDLTSGISDADRQNFSHLIAARSVTPHVAMK